MTAQSSLGNKCRRIGVFDIVGLEPHKIGNPRVIGIGYRLHHPKKNNMSDRPATLDVFDCRRDGDPSQSELLIVEGESAWRTVIALRDEQSQAVLPMQGKPINASRRTRAAVMKNLWIARLIETIVGVDHAAEMIRHGEPFRITSMRYERIVMLFDPDADGIHCGGLLTAFFGCYMSEMVAAKRLMIVHPPRYVVRGKTAAEILHLDNDQQLESVRGQLRAAGVPHQVSRYRGLASIEADVIKRRCLDPKTRIANFVSHSDVDAFAKIFNPGEA